MYSYECIEYPYESFHVSVTTVTYSRENINELYLIFLYYYDCNVISLVLGVVIGEYIGHHCVSLGE